MNAVKRTGAGAAATSSANPQPIAGRVAPAVRSAGRNASIVGLAFVVSRILGLFREILLGYRFGTSSEYDAYVSAFRVPDLLFLVVMSGAFGSAFIPIFGGFLASGDRDRAWRLASAVISLTAVITVAVGSIAFVLAGPIMRYVVAPDLPADVQPLAARTMRILLLSPIFLGLGIAAKGILEAQDQFTLPAVAPVAYNAAIIVATLVFAPAWGVEGVAVGVAVGALLHVVVQIPGLVRSGMRFTPGLSTQVDGLQEVGRLLLPRVIGLAAFQINFVVMTNLASGAGPGRVSALNYAWQMMMLPHGVVALSISTVIFPAMARQYQAGRFDELRRTFTGALRPLLFLTIPASVALFEFRTALPQTLFQFGAFDADSTQLVAPALGFLAVGLIWYALVEVLTRIFYAMQDTVTPVAAGIAIIVVNVMLGVVLVERIGHVGLALALSASTGIEALILFVVLRRRVGGFDPTFGGWIGKVMLAAAAMAIVAEAMRPKLDAATATDGSHLSQIALLVLSGGIVAATYALAAYHLSLPEMERALSVLQKRMPSRLREPWRR